MAAPECSSCHARVRWIRTEKGKSMPLDPVPVPGGNIVIRTVGRQQVAHVLTKLERNGDPLFGTEPSTEARYLSHYVTCPNAKQHRRKR